MIIEGQNKLYLGAIVHFLNGSERKLFKQAYYVIQPPSVIFTDRLNELRVGLKARRGLSTSYPKDPKELWNSFG